MSAWLDRPGAPDRLLPPWESADGKPQAWSYVPQVIADGEDASLLQDAIEYRPGWLGTRLPVRLLRRVVYRHQILAADLRRHAGTTPRRILLSGASGLLGRTLAAFLCTGGHRVVRLVRRRAAAGGEITWDPAAGKLDPRDLEGLDAAVHLSGENIGGGRWTPARKQAIRDSRVRTTELLARSLAELAAPPRVFISASAVGIYGAHGDEPVDEDSAAGTGFLSEVATAWEGAAAPAADRGIRVAHLRLGVVLSPHGGALSVMLPVFRMGAGGRMGAGTQIMSWVTVDDVLGAAHKVLFDDRLSGAVNVAAPGAASNAEFTRTLGNALGRPTLFPVPAGFIKLGLGEMGQALLLDGVRAVPRRLQAAGYEFAWPMLAPALKHMLGRGSLPAVRPTDRGAEVDL